MSMGGLCNFCDDLACRDRSKATNEAEPSNADYVLARLRYAIDTWAGGLAEVAKENIVSSAKQALERPFGRVSRPEASPENDREWLLDEIDGAREVLRDIAKIAAEQKPRTMHVVYEMAVGRKLSLDSVLRTAGRERASR